MLLSTSSLASCSCLGGPELQKFTHSPADPHNLRGCRRHPGLRRLLGQPRLRPICRPQPPLSMVWATALSVFPHTAQRLVLSCRRPPSSIHRWRTTRNCRGPRPLPWLRSAAPASGWDAQSPQRPPLPETSLSLWTPSHLTPQLHSEALLASSPRRGAALTAPSNAAAICKPQSTFSASLLITVSTTWDSLVYGLTPPSLSFLLEYELHGARIFFFFTATTQKSSRHGLEVQYTYAEYINESETPGNHPFISFFLPLKAEANQTHYQR